MEKKKQITVAIKSSDVISEVAKQLKKVGVSDISELKLILTITGSWDGPIDEIKKIDGVDDVEVQETRYFPS